ncbi:MAG: hypothetical protein ACOX6I_08155 [Syntrophomonadaceae bacterium]|jgi:hypothetical protein
MEHSLSIWSPVIIAELNYPRKCRHRIIFTVDRWFDSLEDIRIKIKHSTARMQGKKVETTIKLEALFLVRDSKGHLELITRPQIVKDRVSPEEFEHYPKSFPEADLIVDIIDLSWEGGLSGWELNAVLFIEYQIIAVKEQIVRLFAGDHGDMPTADFPAEPDELEQELLQAVQEKAELQQQLLVYQRNIKSLKQGIAKLESRNRTLNQEIKGYQTQINLLQEKLARHEQEVAPGGAGSSDPLPYFPAPELNAWTRPRAWASKIKNRLINLL